MFELKDKLREYDVILASQSPRRKELLSIICDDFKVIPAVGEEIFDGTLGVDKIPEQLALNKCKEIAEQYPQSMVIGCDTVVTIDERIMGKPKDEADAFDMLKTLSGITHEVISAAAVYKEGSYHTFSEVTKVTFKDLSDKEIRSYIATGEPSDKAGAYGIQGQGCLLVSGIEGDYFNVVGLPVSRLADLLSDLV